MMTPERARLLARSCLRTSGATEIVRPGGGLFSIAAGMSATVVGGTAVNLFKLVAGQSLQGAPAGDRQPRSKDAQSHRSSKPAETA